MNDILFMIINYHAFEPVDSFSLCSMYFHETAKDAPWTEFMMILVDKPLKNTPETPSALMISDITCPQLMFSFEVCLKVLTTLTELTNTSVPRVDRKPMAPDLITAFENCSLQLQEGRQAQRQLWITNQEQCEREVAKISASPPWQKAETPKDFDLLRRIFRPSLPWTCLEVFQVFIGRMSALQSAEIMDPNAVCTQRGSLPSSLDYFDVLMASVLDATSPKRQRGPISKAGTSPRYKRNTSPS